MRHTFMKKVASVPLLALALVGCMSTEVRREIATQEEDVKAAFAQAPVTAAASFVQSSDAIFIPVRREKVVGSHARSAWLASIRTNVKLDEPTTLKALIAGLSDDGVNVVSDVSLDNYTWAGQVKNASVETMLRVVLGNLGLDYDVDDARRLVTIRPVRSKTWTLNVGPRSTTYSSGGVNANSLTANDSDVTAAGGGGVGGRAYSSSVGAGTGQDASTGARIHASDNFWQSLRSELDNRLQVRLPVGQGSVVGQGNGPAAVAPAAPITGGASGTGAVAEASSGQGARNWVGSYALNPETGSVTVSAPAWVLNDLDSYMAKVQAMYSASISFKGKLLMVSRKRSDSEGVDITSFAKFASGRYGAVIQNGALGGVQVSMPSAGGLPSVTAGAQKVGGALIGVTSAADSLQVFNAWLSENGEVSIVEEPVVTTTSGVPAEFSNKLPTYYNLVSQKAASGGISGAVNATENTLMAKSFGTQMTINPRFDYSTGLIRAQISLNHVMPNGSQEIKQTITSGNSVTTIPTVIPLGTEMSYSGEALLRDGDLIIIGGLSKQNRTLSEDGLPGRKAPLSLLTGKKSVSRDQQTYYFALQVEIKER